MLSAVTEVYPAGITPGSGTFACTVCATHVSLESLEQLPTCPRCGGSEFRRPSMFEDLDEQPTEPTAEMEFPETERNPDWLAAARREITEPGRYLAYLDAGVEVVAIEPGWTKIGRSVRADLRLDDPTVSRRHAIVVWEDGAPMRVLDDRSLNGLFLNGDVVDWATLSDGDVLAVGRFRLVLLEAE
jgi:hypothetical protein